MNIAHLHRQSFKWMRDPAFQAEGAFFARWAEELKKGRAYHAEWARQWRKRNPEKVREANLKAYAKNPEKHRRYAKERRDRIKLDPVASKKLNNYHLEKILRREKTDPVFRLGRRIRGRILMSLKRGLSKAGRTCELIGCTIPELKAYLESRFLPGMSWENHGKGDGKWHIDHKRPCSSFDLSDPAEQFQCFHYTNLQPLWEFDNLSKGSKFTPPLP